MLEGWRIRRERARFGNVGEGLRLIGAPTVYAGGKIEIGDRFYLSSVPVPSHMVAGAGARLSIGDDVSIGFGAAISAFEEVIIGSRTVIGPYVIIMDTNFHRGAGDHSLQHDCDPVVIGAGCRIGSGVTITRGSRIGDGAEILAGSLVTSDIPEGACAGGCRARVLGTAGDPACRWDGPLSRLPALLMQSWGLQTPPGLDPTPIPASLREDSRMRDLCDAIQSQMHLVVPLPELASATTFHDIAQAVRRVAMERLPPGTKS